MRVRDEFRACLSGQFSDLAKSGALASPAPPVTSRYPARVVLTLARDPRPLVRRVVAECARTVKGSVRVLLRLTSDENAEVRSAAIESVASLLEGGRCPPELLARMGDRDTLVRTVTAGALGQIGDARALPSLWAALADASPLVRSYVAAAIGQLGTPKDTARLVARAKLERSPAARIGFCDGVYRLGDRPFALGRLLRLLANRDYRVRCAAANTLASLQIGRNESLRVRKVLRLGLKQERTPAGREAMLRCIRALKAAR